MIFNKSNFTVNTAKADPFKTNKQTKKKQQTTQVCVTQQEEEYSFGYLPHICVIEKHFMMQDAFLYVASKRHCGRES